MPRTVGAAHAVAGSTAGAALHRLTSRTIGNICMETPMTYIHTQGKRETSVRTTGKAVPKEHPTSPAAWPEMAPTTTETQQSPAARPNNERHQRGINGVNGAESADERRPRQRHRSRGLTVGCQRSRSRPYAIWAPAIDHGQCTKPPLAWLFLPNEAAAAFTRPTPNMADGGCTLGYDG
jgi:hypothetical protein